MLPRDHYLKQAFQDTIRFPDGFEKGGLSDIQARLIRKHGTLISALSIDEVSDATPDDLHILKVIANQSAPKSPVEQAWIKYLTIIKNLANTGSGKTKTPKPKATKTVQETPPEPIKPSKNEITPAASAQSNDSSAPLKAKAKTEPSTATAKIKPEATEPKKMVPAKPKAAPKKIAVPKKVADTPKKPAGKSATKK